MVLFEETEPLKDSNGVLPFLEHDAVLRLSSFIYAKRKIEGDVDFRFINMRLPFTHCKRD